MLLPGEFSRIDGRNQSIEKGNFDAYEVLAWKEGRLIFENNTLEEIIPKLEMWYGVQIKNELADNTITKPYSSTFERENLDNILTNISTVLNFEYIINGNQVVLKN